MHLPVYFIDTFTNTPFRGNPAAVCFIQGTETAGFFQSVAAEVNLPVTAFIAKRPGTQGDYDIKYFTPTTEISACGHATLGSSSVVNKRDGLTTARFHTASGVIITAKMEDGQVRMTYPKYDWKPAKPEKRILEGLGLKDYQEAAFCPELETLFVVMESPQQLRTVRPDHQKLLNSSDVIKEIVLTSVSDSPGYDYLLRSFCPWIGIDEDPVTGSVHSVLAGYWSEQLNKKLLKAYQASQRGGELSIEAKDNETGIGGSTVLILQGEITV